VQRGRYTIKVKSLIFHRPHQPTKVSLDDGRIYFSYSESRKRGGIIKRKRNINERSKAFYTPHHMMA
jgi:hypothetical protein